MDVERESDRDIDRLAEMVLTAAERDALTAMADRRRGFHTYWSRKEALLKATGHGLAAPMTSIHVSAPDEPAAVVAWDGEAAVSPSASPTSPRAPATPPRRPSSPTGP